MCTDIVWNSGGVQFKISASASNPLNVYAPPVDYVLHVCVKRMVLSMFKESMMDSLVLNFISK